MICAYEKRWHVHQVKHTIERINAKASYQHASNRNPREQSVGKCLAYDQYIIQIFVSINNCEH